MVILLIVYRSPLLAMVPLVTIALSVVVSLKAIALLTRVPGLTFQVINITRRLRGRGLVRGRDRLLLVPDRPVPGGTGSRPNADRRAPRGDHPGGRGVVASAGTVIIGLGMLYFSSFAKIQYTGPAIALTPGGGPACGPDAGSDSARAGCAARSSGRFALPTTTRAPTARTRAWSSSP